MILILWREKERRERVFIVPVQVYKGICLTNLYWDNTYSDSDSLTRESERAQTFCCSRRPPDPL